MELAYTVEPNPGGTGYHANVLQRGRAKLPVRAVSRLADRCGMGRVTWVTRLRDLEASSWYVVKLAASAYSLKLAHDPAELRVYLEANGGRMVHASRGFWRDAQGEPLAGVRAARRAALDGLAEVPRHTWRYRLVAA